MKTENLIQALAADLPTKPPTLARSVTLALLVSIPVAFALLLFVLHVRPDFWVALGKPRFLFKFVFTLGTFAAGLWLVARVSRPGTKAGPALLACGAVLLLLAGAVVAELLVLPSRDWMPSLVGTMAVPCITLVPMLSIVPLAAVLFALRSGAPDNPSAAGAAGGLLAGAIGATFYAPYCPNDSPLFVATWYVIAIAAVALAGSLIGRWALRW
jgi:hypothetical protein